ncbi:HET-domain-containing protein [Rhypophila decipiens]|uniref:HET-domain-containing protein n=1 Tax=Rhypophila decipiens TaxID=261697 RepID=A0AAN6YBT7_9PEZI|nr:HET-domain-containing protein [Rhypophila decipiens]
MTTPNPLCAHCLEIPSEKCYNDEKCFDTHFSLGSPSRIHSSDCPLCCFVSKALIRSKNGDVLYRFEDEDTSVTLTWASTFRIQVPGLRPAFTVLAGAPWVGRGFLASSCLLPKLPPELDVGRELRWVDSCTAKHDCLLQPDSEPFSRVFPGLEVLRLIDVVQGCLVETREPAEYIVLSYVWGSIANFRLTKANRLNLMLPGALQKVDHLLPKTIHDAITLVRGLGIRYLWVDSICLVQNDPEDLKRGVQVMDQIFEYSWLASFRFQEHFLSRRKLYFFEDEVTFRCRHCECLESCRDVADPKLRMLHTSRLWDSTNHDFGPVFEYRAVLEHYTQRTLTNQSDALRAMAGHATGAFDYFIMLFGSNLRRRQGLPSYSWAGWIGRVGIVPNVSGHIANHWLRDQTWIIWYTRTPSGVLSLVWDPEANPSFNTLDKKLEGYRRRSQFRCPQPLAIDTTRTVPAEEAPSLNRPLPSYPILQFYTMVVYLRFGDRDVFKPQADLIGRDGAVNGRVILDGFEGTTFFESNDPFELVLLSEADGWPEVYFPRGYWNYYKVMLIEWEGGRAERRGIGVIEKEAIHHSFQPGPQWKEIVLG